MNKRVIMTMVVVAVMLGLVAGCGGKKVGKLSEEDFIELNAQIMVVGAKERDSEVMSAKIDGLLKKYGMTQEELNNLSSGPEGDELRKRLGPKIMQRAQELRSK